MHTPHSHTPRPLRRAFGHALGSRGSLRAARSAAVAAVAALGAACGEGASLAAPGSAASRAVAPRAPEACQPSVRNQLEHAADGLLYTSESDFPFEFFCSAALAAEPLTAESFRALIGAAPDAPIEEITVDEFFARHIERVDPNDAVAVALVPRYQELKETILATLDQPRVYRVGLIAVRCYVVGRDKRGNVAGLATTAIET
jgi:hypothetical protein